MDSGEPRDDLLLPTMSQVLVGADVGGSKTAVAVERAGAVVARAAGPGAAVRPGRALQSAATVAEVVRRALAEAGELRAAVLVVGAAGAGRQPEQSELERALRGEQIAERVVVVTDIEIALVAAFGDAPGIVVSAGTGSIAVGRDKNGALKRMGGYGWQMGDEGSGYAVGRAALLAVGRAQDGRGPATTLSKSLPAHPPAKSFEELVRWSGAAEPGEIAALAPLVFAAAAAGDAAATEIVEGAAEDLAGLVASLTGLFPGRGRVEVALAGGNLAPDRGLRAAVLTRLAKLTRVHAREAPLDPAEGALALARRQ